MAATLITRSIFIDSGHRIHRHVGECSSIHGHRYKIEAHLSGKLHADGTDTGMVMDFGIIKSSMMSIINESSDHALILSLSDPLLKTFVKELDVVEDSVLLAGYWSSIYNLTNKTLEDMKIYVIEGPPTAAELSKHWYKRLGEDIETRTGKHLLQGVTVYETPNCSATYGDIW